jgi:hypothetical protein
MLPNSWIEMAEHGHLPTPALPSCEPIISEHMTAIEKNAVRSAAAKALTGNWSDVVR